MATTLNDNLQFNTPKPADNRIGKFVSGQYLPYDSVSDANARIPSAYRYRGLTVMVLSGGSPVEHWYKDGTSDNQLVVKYTKAYVGLSNVDNTTDLAKPLSTAAQTALNGKQDKLTTGTTAQYFRGDLSLGNFQTDVRAQFTAGTNITISNGVISATGTGGGGTPAPSIVTQVHNSGPSVTVANSTTRFIVDPASVISVLTITFPAAPADAQPLEISFGGTIASGTVVNALTLNPNSGQAILSATLPSQVEAGESIIFRYREANAKWYRLF